MRRLAAATIALALASAAWAGDSQGISGHMIAAVGNASANPRAFECAKIFDASGQHLIAHATCSGIYGQFRVPLPSGRYAVEFAGIKPQRQTVSVSVGKWTELGPKRLGAPVP